MEIIETSDRTLLREALRRDAAGTLYMAADLESPFFEQCRWLVELEDARATAVVLAFFGLQTPSVLAAGNLNALQRILRRYGPELPARFHTKLTNAQLGIFGDEYRFSDIEELDVMVLGEARQTTLPDGVEVRLITPTDPLEPILTLYRGYPGNFFERSQLQSGLYAGVWVGTALAAIGGTHVYAPGEGIAVLGNITTAERFRGQGHCRAVVAYLSTELKNRGCNLIGLHVASTNAPAIACYSNCGFKRHHSVYQMLTQKKQSLVTTPADQT